MVKDPHSLEQAICKSHLWVKLVAGTNSMPKEYAQQKAKNAQKYQEPKDYLTVTHKSYGCVFVHYSLCSSPGTN